MTGTDDHRSLRLKGRYYRHYPAGEFLGYAEETFNVAPEEAAFVLVDVYGLGFAEGEETPDRYPLGSAESFAKQKDIVVNHIRPAAEAARTVKMPVVYVSNSAPKIALEEYEFTKWAKRAANHALYDVYMEDCVDPKEYHYGDPRLIAYSKAIEPQPDDYFVRKFTYSGFYGTHLDQLLRNLGTKVLFFVGFSLDICLHCTMIDALYRNYKVVLLRDSALAFEMPDDLPTWAWTKRMILWTESFIAVTITAEQFIVACEDSIQTAG